MAAADVGPDDGLDGLDGPVDGAPLTVAALARRLGVSPTTLRTWDRRYGLGPSAHEPGRHRRYAPTDVDRLQLMRRLTLEGVPTGEAARIAADTPPRPLSAGRSPTRTGPSSAPSRLRGVSAAADAQDRVRGLAAAAQALDVDAVTALVRESLDRRGVVATWDHLVVPVLVAVGRRWERTGRGVDVEHLASEGVLAALHGYAHGVGGVAINPRPVLLACAEEEQHSLPLFAVAAALAERHVASRVLGARVPAAALAAAVRRAGPCAVFVWSHAPATGGLAQLASLPVTRPPVRLVLGGVGWVGTPPGAEMVADLAEAVGTLASAAGSPR